MTGREAVPISRRVRVTTVIFASILACGPPASVPDAGPIGDAASARPSIRGTRLVAPRADGSAQPLAVTVTSPVAPGDTATATVETAAGSRCEIEVTYRSGPSEAQGLDPAIASDEGGVSWTWIVGINTTPGEWVVEVECADADGRRATGRALLTVREPDPASPTGSAEGGR